jgi:hypothetical protein
MHLVLWKHLGMDFIRSEAKLCADPQGQRPTTSRHHDDALERELISTIFAGSMPSTTAS